MAVSHTHTIYRGLCDKYLHNPSRHKIIIESYSNWFLCILKRISETVENFKGSLITLYMLNYERKKIYCSYGFSIFVDILLLACAIKSLCHGIYIWSHIKVTSPINLWPALVYPRLQPDWTLSLWHYNVYKLNQINKCNLSYTVRAQFARKKYRFLFYRIYIFVFYIRLNIFIGGCVCSCCPFYVCIAHLNAYAAFLIE